MLFVRQGWEKSTSKNVAKAYLDIQITANHCTLYYTGCIKKNATSEFPKKSLCNS
jgi:hypothetical protein